MHASATLPTGLLFGFLLVLTRVAGVFVFVPLPGIRSGPEASRVALSLAVTMALSPRWPVIDMNAATGWRIAAWILAEAATGVASGIVIAILLEAFAVAAQVLGLQAGYAYASVVDPTTNADSSVLMVMAQLAAGLMFFAVGLDRELVRSLAGSLETIPPGSYALSRVSAEPVIRMGAAMFGLGLRLALPVIALLLMIDVALALLGRLNAQLQLLSLAFPAKMLVSLVVLSWTIALFPRSLKAFAGTALHALRAVLGL